MKKTYLALALLITGLLLVGNAYGEEDVYYCAEIHSVGFGYKDGLYVPATFQTEKFKIKLDKALNTIEMRPEWASETMQMEDGSRVVPSSPKYVCRDNYGMPELLKCFNTLMPHYFHFNTKNGRFVSSRNGGYFTKGSVFLEGKEIKEPISTSYGKCDKF